MLNKKIIILFENKFPITNTYQAHPLQVTVCHVNYSKTWAYLIPSNPDLL